VSWRTGIQTYHNAWATDHILNEQRVVEVAANERRRWKVENEGLKVLKNQGYNFEHSYGHGQQHLSMVSLTPFDVGLPFAYRLGPQGLDVSSSTPGADGPTYLLQRSTSPDP